MNGTTSESRKRADREDRMARNGSGERAKDRAHHEADLQRWADDGGRCTPPRPDTQGVAPFSALPVRIAYRRPALMGSLLFARTDTPSPTR
jgi:hypothetical protein